VYLVCLNLMPRCHMSFQYWLAYVTGLWHQVLVIPTRISLIFIILESGKKFVNQILMLNLENFGCNDAHFFMQVGSGCHVN